MTKLDFTKRKINGFFIVKEGICELETPTGWVNQQFDDTLLFIDFYLNLQKIVRL